MTPRLLVILALLPACAYQTAIKRGDSAAAAGQFPTAYEAYSFANDTKGTPVAAAGMKDSLGRQLTAASLAADNGEFEAAFALIQTAEAMDALDPRVAETRTKAQNKLIDALPNRTQGALPEAYAFAAMAKRLHPRSWVVEDVLRGMRDRVVADARAKQDASEWAEARAATALILDYEPEHQSLADELDADIVKDWVASLLARADKAERSKPGLAAVLYARAHEVSEEPEYLATARKLYTEAGTQAAQAVFVDSEGSGNRHFQARKALKEDVGSMEGTRAGGSTAYDLQAKLFTNAETCKETQSKEPLTKDYVSGTRKVPNPEHATLTADLAAAKSERDAADKAKERAEAAHATSETQLTALQSTRDDAAKKHGATESILGVTNNQATSSKQARDEVAKEVKTHKDKGEDGLAAAAQKRLDTTDAIYQEWADKQKVDSKAEADAKAALDAADAKLIPHKKSHEDLTAKLATARTRSEKANADEKALTAKLGNTSKTLDEDVKATLAYEKIEWTTTCEVATTAYFTPRWKSELEKKQKFSSTRSMKDSSQKGNEGAGVPEDPKAYPRDQKELVAELEVESRKQLADATDAFVADYFKTTSAAALADDTDVDGATHTLITLYSGALPRLDDATRKAAVAYVVKHHDLGNYGLLDPKYAEAAPAPKAEEPKTEEPRAEEPKKEEPKPVAAKEEPKKEEPKAEEPKKEEPKAEEPKKEEPKKEEGEWVSPWK